MMKFRLKIKRLQLSEQYDQRLPLKSLIIGYTKRSFGHTRNYIKHHRVLVNGVAVAAIIVVFVIANSNVSNATFSYWTQSDWSGGVGSSTTNQYSSESNLTASSGNVTLVQGSNLVTNGNFSTDLSGWNGGTIPSQISGMDLWLNASSITGVSSGNPVSSWTDSSGNSNNFSQANASLKPLYETNVLNGQPAVQFAPNQELTQSGSLTHGSVFIVGSRSSTSEPFAEVGGGTISNNRGLIGLYYPTYATYANYWVNGVTQGGNGGGGSVNTQSIFSGTATGTPLYSTTFALGQGTPSYAYLQGDIEEMIIYSTALSTANREAVESYLQAKYNVGSAYVNATRNTSITYNGNTASAQLVSGSIGGQYVQSINVGNTSTYGISAYAYTNGSAVSSSNVQLTYNGSPVTTTYTSVGSGWSLLSGTVAGIASNATYGVTEQPNQTVYIDGVSVRNITSSGNLVSNIFNTNVEENWGNATYTDSVPTGTTLTVLVRSGNQPNLSDAPAFTSCSNIASGGAITSSCAPIKTQYVQYEIELSSTISAYTPDLESISLGFTPSDTTPPATNATNIYAYNGNGGASVASQAWANTEPYFSWTAATDHVGGSGIAGYCLYLGQSSSGNPVTSSGDLSTSSPLSTGGACPFAVSSTDLDTSINGYLTSVLAASTQPYYLNIDAITGAGVVWNNSPTQFEFYYDNTTPTNPAFVTAPSEFVSSDEVTLTWPTTGADAASDSISGVAGLQYRIGASGTWYGVLHNSNQNMTDLLANNGSYTTISNPDFGNLVEGNNIVYFRTWSNSGVVSPAFVTTVIKINTTSPSSPQNLTATPTTNITNSFGFSWLAPATFTGTASNITYCYTINATPTSSNCNYTAAGQTSLSAGAYATEPGSNTIYLVAKDEAGNINYATAASTTFTANTPAPGIPLNTDIADISVKATSTWKLAVSWDVPSTIGAGIATYKVLRSTDGINYSQIASTAGTSYVDTGLTQQTYYYEIEACDSANNCGGLTAAVSDYPTGKFTSPANLIDGPTSSVSTRSATITWITDRDSDSSIEYGLSSGVYFSTQASNSDQVVTHSITLNNLQAGTTYYYSAQWTDEDGNVGTSPEQTFTTLPAPTVSNVSVSNINLNNATINFTSTGASAVKLYYGTSSGFGTVQTQNTSADTSNYSINLNSLNSGTIYYFKLNTIDAFSNEYDAGQVNNFTTPPQPVITNVQFSPVQGALTGTEEIFWTTNVPATSQISYGLLNGARSNQLDTTLTTSHEMTISDLTYNTQYSVTATSVDSLGNVANSDLQIFKSGIDTRPPVISDITLQPSIVGNGASAKGQLIVSWKTDKAGTSQVAYGNGAAGDYTTTTAANSQLVNNHVVVISGLATSEVYHVEVVSNDADGIRGVSTDQTTIIGQASDNALSIVFNSLQNIFGL